MILYIWATLIILYLKINLTKTIVDYNENGVPIGENVHKLQSFIGFCVHHHIPITHASWKLVPTKLKGKIYNMVEVCNNPFSFGNHAKITHIVYFKLYYVVTILQLW